MAGCQELPHPISKVVWDNYVAISSLTAKSIDAATNDLIMIQSSVGSVTLPALIQPGQAEDTISIASGTDAQEPDRLAAMSVSIFDRSIQKILSTEQNCFPTSPFQKQPASIL